MAQHDMDSADLRDAYEAAHMFVVGSNNPGFLPEDVDEVVGLDTAKQVLIEDIERFYDDREDLADESSPHVQDFLRWLEGRIELIRNASGPINVMIEGRVYFIQAAT